MKTKLSFLLFSITFIIYSQTPISSFDSAPQSIYEIVTATLNQTTSGANVTWNFNTLVASGSTNTDTYATPTAGELTTYPGTTQVLTITKSPAATSTNVFSKNISNTVSMTGVAGTSFSLNYITDNALIGTFPLNYGYSNTDTVAGTFSGAYTGTFTGTIIVSVDAYGTLNMNDVGGGVFSGNITRLKTVQNLNILVSTLLGSAPGTVTQTSYNYYTNNGDLVLRTSDTNISVPALAVNQNSSSIESLIISTLSINKNDFISDEIILSPNPANDLLNIHLKNDTYIKSIQINDLTGKKVLMTNGNNLSINVGQLQTGFYFVTVTTENGIATRKFIKK